MTSWPWPLTFCLQTVSQTYLLVIATHLYVQTRVQCQWRHQWRHQHALTTQSVRLAVNMSPCVTSGPQDTSGISLVQCYSSWPASRTSQWRHVSACTHTHARARAGCWSSALYSFNINNSRPSLAVDITRTQTDRQTDGRTDWQIDEPVVRSIIDWLDKW